MTALEAIKSRHAVRSFLDKPLDENAVQILQEEIKKCNEESGFNIQLVLNEPNAFQAEKPHYGQFKNCRNYLAIVGPKGEDEKAGYYGERIVIKAQELGINSCWVAFTYKSGLAEDTKQSGEKRYLVVALGYGETNGNPHNSKSISDVSNYKEDDPEWFKEGIESALLAPTSMNQQKFKFLLENGKVTAKPGIGFYTKIDLGIAKYNFEIGSGKGKEIWN